MPRRILCLLFALAASTLPLGGCGGDEAKPFDGTLRVGIILPMTGPQATYGEESWNGIQLAQQDLEAAGLPEVTTDGGGKERFVYQHIKIDYVDCR